MKAKKKRKSKAHHLALRCFQNKVFLSTLVRLRN
jgi:hypothetical protein